MLTDIWIGESLRYDVREGPLETAIHIEHAALSSLLAKLSGTQFQLLIAVALNARPLIRDRQFQQLLELQLADETDLGKLFVYLPQDKLAHMCGLNSETVGKNLTKLEENALLTKRLQRARGRFTMPLILIHADPVPGKNRDGRTVTDNPPTCFVVVDSFSSPESKQQPTTDTQMRGKTATAAALVFAEFAHAVSLPDYEPTQRDIQLLDELLTEGCDIAQIIATIRDTVESALARGIQPRHFTYCADAIRAAPLHALTVSTDAAEQARASENQETRSLPNDIWDRLIDIGWAGPIDEVAEFYRQDAGLVESWLTYCEYLDNPGVRSVPGLFRNGLRSKCYAPEVPESRIKEVEQQQYIKDGWERLIQH
ncbi:MAG: hypothetical protein JXA14_01975 [Anaerolineae bacterium]|nr:hypothetical protein [Anaerolineae bacterium]